MSPKNNDVIYDFGMNEGLNLEYYLKKSSRVVGVDANPAVCNFVKKKFHKSIAEGHLVIVNCVLSANESPDSVDFYLHKFDSILSQFPKPKESEIDNFSAIKLPQKKASSIIKEHGPPLYVKIDLEKTDQLILEDLYKEKIIPPYISAEAHEPEVFLRLLQMGYEVFNLVDGPSVDIVYSKTKIKVADSMENFSFRTHSAGPFGEDITSPWRDKNSFLYLLAAASLGWKDIHATTVLNASADGKTSLIDVVNFREHLRALIPSFIRAVKFRSRKFISSI